MGDRERKGNLGHMYQGGNGPTSKYSSVSLLGQAKARDANLPAMQDSRRQEESLEQDETHLKERAWKVPKIIQMQQQIDAYREKNTELLIEYNKLQAKVDEMEDKLRENTLARKNSSRMMQRTTSQFRITTNSINNAPTGMLMTAPSFHVTDSKLANSKLDMSRSEQDLGPKVPLGIVQLENKKEKRTITLSTLKSHNEMMKQSIDLLRKELILQDQITRNLIKEGPKLMSQLQASISNHEKLKSVESNPNVVDRYKQAAKSTKEFGLGLKSKVERIRHDMNHLSNEMKKERLERLKHRDDMYLDDNAGSDHEQSQPGGREGSKYGGQASTFLKASTIHAQSVTERFLGKKIEDVGVFPAPRRKWNVSNHLGSSTGFGHFSASNINHQKASHHQPEAESPEIQHKREMEKSVREESRRLEAKIAELESLASEFQFKNGQAPDVNTALLNFHQGQEEYRKLDKDLRFYLDKVEGLKTAKHALLLDLEAAKNFKIKDIRHRDRVKENFLNEIKKNEEMMAVYEQHKQDSSRIVNAIKIAIPNIFKKIGCEPLKDSMYGEGVVTENNILEFLSLIEKRADEILTMYDGNQDSISVKEKRKTEKYHDDMAEKLVKSFRNAEPDQLRAPSSQSIPLANTYSRDEDRQDQSRILTRQGFVKEVMSNDYVKQMIHK